jgi:hypothetical protein
MFWYSGSSWLPTQNFYAHDSGSWKDVKDTYIYDAGSWKLVYSRSGTLDSFTIENIDPLCDTTTGLYRASWTYTATSPSLWSIRLETDFGSGFETIGTVDVTDNTFDGDLSGFVGFTDIDLLEFRCTMYLTSNPSIEATSSPRTATPPHTCL